MDLGRQLQDSGSFPSQPCCKVIAVVVWATCTPSLTRVVPGCSSPTHTKCCWRRVRWDVLQENNHKKVEMRTDSGERFKRTGWYHDIASNLSLRPSRKERASCRPWWHCLQKKKLKKRFLNHSLKYWTVASAKGTSEMFCLLEAVTHLLLSRSKSKDLLFRNPGEKRSEYSSLLADPRVERNGKFVSQQLALQAWSLHPNKEGEGDASSGQLRGCRCFWRLCYLWGPANPWDLGPEELEQNRSLSPRMPKSAEGVTARHPVAAAIGGWTVYVPPWVHHHVTHAN